MTERNDGVKIGWAQCNITPDRNVYLCGQLYARVSEGVMDPVTSTALAIESVRDSRPDGCVVMVSCDLASISDELRDAVRARIRSEIPGFDPLDIFFSGTHTHSAPLFRVKQRYVPESHQRQQDTSPPYGIELDAMEPAEYVEWAAGKIAGVIKEAWNKRRFCGIGYGVGHAVVGRNRRLTYGDGTSKMYGRADTPDFSHVEGYEDHSVYAMITYNEDGNVNGMVVNVPCPSQVSENSFHVTADYWHETRNELRRRFGEEIHVLAQCAPAGDQSPHVLVGARAEERMWRLRDTDLGRDRSRDSSTPREEIARRIADAVDYIIPAAGKEIDWSPEFAHRSENLALPRRKLTKKDVEDIAAEKENYRKEYESLLDEIEKKPEKREENRWYISVTRPYKKMKWLDNVERRLELQKTHPDIPMELHAVRLGDIAFSTNPFELYLDYGIRMRELSEATQTFLVQLAGPGSYLPSERSIAHKGYGSVPASTDIGPEGGEKLVEWTVGTLNDMFDKTE